jgi:ubiquinone/menaquinone biosynthesis C-methylase UbiE/DNA-binding transcriptional ArsR family regulator
MNTTNTVQFGKALADETRQKIMQLCCCTQLSVNEIVDLLNVAQPTVSHHLKILKDAGLVQVERRGKLVYYTLDQERMAEGCCQVADTFAPEQPVEDIRNAVREHYGQIASQASTDAVSCCGPQTGSASSCCSSGGDAVSDTFVKFYETSDVVTLPAEVTALSLGCGDPVTLASLQPGQTVLDLGSGGGIDCFLAAKKVGESGFVIGVDMTHEMVAKARSNKAKLGAKNVEFRLGEIEHLPVADGSVDVIISNCVINLSPDKPQVFREAYRVLKPGGRLAVSDIVTDGPLPPAIKASLSAWAGCIAGALDAGDYIAAIAEAGFQDIELTPVYFDQSVIDEARSQLDLDLPEGSDLQALDQAVFSAKVSAYKPVA